MRYYPHFILPMRSSRGFASAATNWGRPFRTRFRFGYGAERLNLMLETASRRIIMQKARRHPGVAPAGLRPLVGMWFQVHYPPLIGVLPIFRSRYFFAIGRQGVLSLAGWTPRIRTRFHVSRPTQVPARTRSPVAYGTVTLYGPTFQTVPLRY